MTVSNGLAATAPEVCRVSVISGKVQVDLGLPAAVPIMAFISDLVELIEARDPDPTEHDEGRVGLVTRQWSLARLGHPAVDPTLTLAEAEIHDGDLLLLRAVDDPESPALFDDLIDAVSRLTDSAFGSWSPRMAASVGMGTALCGVLAAGLLLMLLRDPADGHVTGLAAASVAVSALVTAVLAARRYTAPVPAAVLTGCAILYAFLAGLSFVPGDFGALQLLLGCSVTLVVAVLGYRLTRVGATLSAATATLALFGASAALVRVLWDPAVPKIAAGTLAAAVTLISFAPRSAVALARLPIPPVPTAGAPIDPTEVASRPAIEGIGAVGAMTLPSAAGLARRARLANRYQSGLLIACGVTAGLSAVLACDFSGSLGRPGVILAVVTAVVLCLRGRSFADLVQAGALIVSGAVTALAVAIGFGLADDARLRPEAIAVLLAIAALAMFCGLVGPHRTITPTMRRLGEIAEYLLIVSMIPLGAWAMDLYTMARNL